MAARTMAFDGRQGKWSAEILEAAGIPEHWMPRPVPVGTELGQMPRDIAWDLGFADPPAGGGRGSRSGVRPVGIGRDRGGPGGVVPRHERVPHGHRAGMAGRLADSSFAMYRPLLATSGSCWRASPRAAPAWTGWPIWCVRPQPTARSASSSAPSPPSRPGCSRSRTSAAAARLRTTRSPVAPLSGSHTAPRAVSCCARCSRRPVSRPPAACTPCPRPGSVSGTARHRRWRPAGREQAGRERGAAGPAPGEASAAGLPLGVVGGHATARGAAMVAGGPPASTRRSARREPASAHRTWVLPGSRHQALVPAAAPALRASLSSPPTRLSLPYWR